MESWAELGNEANIHLVSSYTTAFDKIYRTSPTLALWVVKAGEYKVTYMYAQPVLGLLSLSVGGYARLL